MNDWLDAEQRVERAQSLSDSQRFEEALAEIDVALSINPEVATWHAQRGCILEELYRPEEAAKAYEAALDLEPGDCDVASALGAALARLGRFSRALSVFEDLSQSHPEFEPAYCHRIGIYAELGRHEQAEEMFYLAQELSEDCPQCFFHMGNSLASRDDYDRALFCWRRVLELEPESIGVNRRMAQAYRARGELDVAKEYYLRELREDPGNIPLLFELAELILESGQMAMAASRFAQIIELDPQHAESHFALGKIWLRRGHPERALASFRSAEDAGACGLLLSGFGLRVSQALFRLKRYDEARRGVEHELEVDPEDPGLLAVQGDCLLALDKPQKAADSYRRLLAVDGRDADAHHKLAICLLQMGRNSAGLEHCETAIRLKPGFAVAIFTASLVHIREGNWHEARSLLNRAIAADPENAEFARINGRFRRLQARHYLRRLLAPMGWFVRTLRRPIA